MAWFNYVIMLLASLAIEAIFVKQPEGPKAATLSEFEFPRAKNGAELPVVFGTRLMKGLNTAMVRDFKAVAIKDSGGKK